MSITTHVLDTSCGRPAAGVEVVLEREDESEWAVLGRGVTDADGRLRTLSDGVELVRGTYRIGFAVGAYFSAQGKDSFYPTVQIVFTVAAAGEHYHVPLLLSPFGYSTYRGS